MDVPTRYVIPGDIYPEVAFKLPRTGGPKNRRQRPHAYSSDFRHIIPLRCISTIYFEQGIFEDLYK